MDSRLSREKEAHNDLLFHKRRSDYQAIFTTHSKAYYGAYLNRVISNITKSANGREVLEIGSTWWQFWIAPNGITPKKLTCINLSERELELGIAEMHKVNFNIDFCIMDANNLQFEDKSFDFVYGGQILHHLNFEQSISEIHRVLKTNGQILFREPLGINPISKIVRLLTPQARTKDEKPLGFNELALVKKKFSTEFYYEQFFSVPLGVISGFICKEPKNPLTKTGFLIDRTIEKYIPFLRPFYRTILIHGIKK